MATIADKALHAWEIHHPTLLGILSLGATLVFGPKAFAYAQAENWHVDELYTCVFTLATVFTAFLFTFYTFVITAERGFLGRAKTSIYFKRTVRYTLGSIGIGTVVCVATVPLLVVQPVPGASDPWLIFVAVWAALSVWAAASFVRAAYLFAIFASHHG